MRNASPIVVIMALLVFTTGANGGDATCPYSLQNVMGVLSDGEWGSLNLSPDQPLAEEYGMIQYLGYLVGKARSAANPDSQTAACLSMFSTHVTDNETPAKATAFTAGLAGLAPPNVDIRIDEDEIGAAVVRRLGGVPIEEQGDGSDAAALLLGTWDMVELTFEIGDQRDTQAVESGGYVMHFGGDGSVTIGMTLFSEDGTMTTSEGAWSYDSATKVITVIVDEEAAPLPVESLARDRLVLRVFDDKSQIMQTMVFVRTGG